MPLLFSFPVREEPWVHGGELQAELRQVRQLSEEGIWPQVRWQELIFPGQARVVVRCSVRPADGYQTTTPFVLSLVLYSFFH